MEIVSKFYLLLLTKSNQKPLYKTRFMLDELGNLQSEGHGIDSFATMLSIGLGQEQQFTLILQTLQQLRDVYGDSVDKVVQGNTSNIVFLKSTDDSMLDTLQKMSGTTHKAFVNSKSITKDTERVWLQNEGKVTYTMAVQEVPVISYNDMNFISPRNSIVFRAGDAPVWNRNETVLPMSWRLLRDTITHPGHDYTFQTTPTLSSAKEFDVRKNQPNFEKMVSKRLSQAMESANAQEIYKETYGYDDFQLASLDPNVYSNEVMNIILSMVEAEAEADDTVDAGDDEAMRAMMSDEYDMMMANAVENKEMAQVTERMAQNAEEFEKYRYAGGKLSKADFVTQAGQVTRGMEREIAEAYNNVKGDMWQDKRYFYYDSRSGSLYSADSKTLYIESISNSEDLQALNEASKDEKSRVYNNDESGDIDDVYAKPSINITDEFYKFLASFDSDWPFAHGRFSQEMSKLV